MQNLAYKDGQKQSQLVWGMPADFQKMFARLLRSKNLKKTKRKNDSYAICRYGTNESLQETGL